METEIDLDTRKAVLEAELDRAVEEAENPPEQLSPGASGQPPLPGQPPPDVPQLPGERPTTPDREPDPRDEDE